MEALPVSEVIIDPGGIKAEPQAWTCMGAEVTKLIDYIPGRFECQKLIRRKIVRNNAGHMRPNAAPPQNCESNASPTYGCWTTPHNRLELHLPFYS